MKLRLLLSSLPISLIGYPFNLAPPGKLQSLFGSFSKHKKLLRFKPKMSFLLDETSHQKGVFQFLTNRFLICETLLQGLENTKDIKLLFVFYPVFVVSFRLHAYSSKDHSTASWFDRNQQS